MFMRENQGPTAPTHVRSYCGNDYGCGARSRRNRDAVGQPPFKVRKLDAPGSAPVIAGVDIRVF